MAKRSKQPVNKSAFVRDFITANPEANRKAVEGAWLAAGHDGVISSALVSGLRSKLGLTGGSRKAEGEGDPESAGSTARGKKGQERGRPAKNGVTGAIERRPRSGGRDVALAEIEVDLDRLVFKLMALGGMEEIEAELRKVRRRLYRSYSG